MLILQDALYYASHRLFHHRWFYGWCHQGHHRTRQPTPWTSFAFDPPEAVVQALVLVLLVMLVPLHLITLMAVLSTMTVWAIVNHLGLDQPAPPFSPPLAGPLGDWTRPPFAAPSTPRRAFRALLHLLGPDRRH